MSESDGVPPIEELVAAHRELLVYVERRTGNRAVAEDILQDALVKSLDRGDEIRESTLGWFYRVLHNAIVDRTRRGAAEARRMEALAHEPADDPALAQAVCRCVSSLAATLKPEYADALAHVDIEGASVKSYAETAGISANNAGVRVFRARAALRRRVAEACGACAEHGCIDCTCRV